MLRQVQYLQGNLGSHQTNGLATGALVQPMSQQQFQMLQQQGGFMQVPLLLLPAQQDHQYQQPGSVDAQPALTGELVPGGGPVMTNDNAEGGAGFGPADANPDQWGTYHHDGGSTDEVGAGMVPSPTNSVPQDTEEGMMFQLLVRGYDEDL
jgi:hypothetical protein